MHFGQQLFKSLHNIFHLPHENSGIPQKVATRYKCFCQSQVGFFGKGFYFIKYFSDREDDNDIPLSLSQLSSGEQHEVVLIYELIFNIKKGSLILIDEPEISLHVVWQQQFLSDLKKIMDINTDFTCIIATHDLPLTEMAITYPENVSNLCFELDEN